MTRFLDSAAAGLGAFVWCIIAVVGILAALVLAVFLVPVIIVAELFDWLVAPKDRSWMVDL